MTVGQCEYGTGLVYATVAVAAEASLVHLYHAWLGTWKDDKGHEMPFVQYRAPWNHSDTKHIGGLCVNVIWRCFCTAACSKSSMYEIDLLRTPH